MQGEIGRLISSIAQLKGQITRLEIEKLRLTSTRREAAITDLRNLAFQEIELSERALITREALTKMELRTPVSGVIYGSRIFAEHSVISPAEPIMFVIPQDQPLVVIARIEAIHIDQLFLGQSAALRFSAFSQRTTPELIGTITRISADIITDATTAQSYYQIEITPQEAELEKLNGQALLPGMPVETFIKTAERSPLSYLVKPFMDYFNKALRET